ncbi:MAG: ATP-binding protein [Kiritimatiellae bacterium]|nr:ATP-binding protein [Kiritimatiellia bacterium]
MKLSFRTIRILAFSGLAGLIFIFLIALNSSVPASGYTVAIAATLGVLVGIAIATLRSSGTTKPIRDLESTLQQHIDGSHTEHVVTYPAEWQSLSERIHLLMAQSKASHNEVNSLRRALDESLRLQSQRMDAQKMDAVTRMASGVAHDFNNLLTVIIGGCQLAMSDTPSDTMLYKDLLQMLEAAERAAKLTRQLQVFSHTTSEALTPLRLNEALERFAPTLAQIVGDPISLTVKLDPQLDFIHADAGQLEQVLTQLVVNACDAMPNQGALLISTSTRPLTDRTAANDLGVDTGDYVELTVVDTGCGMDADTLSRIYEPFFTTKARAHGIGLATVYGIVKGMNANIHVTSEPGKGTTVQLLFKSIAAATGDTSLMGHETVLVLSNEQYISDSVVDALSENGYHVISAASREEALAKANDRRNLVALVISDVALAPREPLTRDKSESLLYKTVLLVDPHGNTSATDHATAVLSRPFSIEMMLTCVRETLDEVCMLPAHRL